MFDVQRAPKYGDDISRQYHFRARRDYLDVAYACLNDWVVFREVGEGRRGRLYIGIARVVAIRDDPQVAGYRYAEVADYLPFTKPIKISFEGEYLEAGIRAVPRKAQVGQAFHGKSLRDISDADFDNIVRLGFRRDPLLDVQDPEPRRAFAEDGAFDITLPMVRPIERVLVSRLFRDAAFRTLVGDAYGFRCLVSHSHIPDGFGHFEGDAAHLQPVADGGPDIVQNGIYAAGTVHWLIDHHLVSFDPDFTLIVAPGLLSQPELGRLIPAEGQPAWPVESRFWPNAEFRAFHRAAFRRKRNV